MPPVQTRSPFQEGFAAVREEPLLLPAELVWRWSFALVAWLIALYAATTFLDSLGVSAIGRYSVSILRPVVGKLPRPHSFDDVLVRYVWLKFIVLSALTVLWSFAAAVGRAAALRNLVALAGSEDRDEDAGWQFRPMFQLSLMRALWMWIAMGCFVASFLLGHAMMQHGRAARGAFFYVFGVWLSVVFGLMLNWTFGIAPLFCIRNQVNARDALRLTVEFCARQGGRIFCLSAAFFALRLLWAASMLFLVVAPTELAHRIAPGWVLLMIFALFLVYLVGDNALVLARLGAFATLAEIATQPEPQPQPVPPPQPWLPYVPPSDTPNTLPV